MSKKNSEPQIEETQKVEEPKVKVKKAKDNDEALTMYSERIEKLKGKLQDAHVKKDIPLQKKLRRQLRAIGYYISKEAKEIVQQAAEAVAQS